jgi:choline dehydrogenase
VAGFTKPEKNIQMDSKNERHSAADFAERVRMNQQKLSSHLKAQYDFIVCGSGSSGSVVARRLADNPDVNVLLLEAGGGDDIPEVMEAGKWPMNLGSERDWSFQAQPSSALNGRSIHLPMGKVLGGGSSINVMAWARGHKSDWDFFASEAGDLAWSYESVLELYRHMEYPTQSTAEPEGRFLSSPPRTPTRSLLPCSKVLGRLGFQPLRIRTAG